MANQGFNKHNISAICCSGEDASAKSINANVNLRVMMKIQATFCCFILYLTQVYIYLSSQTTQTFWHRLLQNRIRQHTGATGLVFGYGMTHMYGAGEHTAERSNQYKAERSRIEQLNMLYTDPSSDCVLQYWDEQRNFRASV